MSHRGIAYGGTVVEINDNVLLIVTDSRMTITADTENVSGADQTVGSGAAQLTLNVLRPTAIGRQYTFSYQLHYESGTLNAAIAACETAAGLGTVLDVTSVDSTGNGVEFKAFLSSFDRGGAAGGLWDGSATMEVTNVPTAITPGS